MNHIVTMPILTKTLHIPLSLGSMQNFLENDTFLTSVSCVSIFVYTVVISCLALILRRHTVYIQYVCVFVQKHDMNRLTFAHSDTIFEYFSRILRESKVLHRQASQLSLNQAKTVRLKKYLSLHLAYRHCKILLLFFTQKKNFMEIHSPAHFHFSVFNLAFHRKP